MGMKEARLILPSIWDELTKVKVSISICCFIPILAQSMQAVP